MSISTKKGDNKISINMINNKTVNLSKTDIYCKFVGELDILNSFFNLTLFKIKDKEIKAMIENISFNIIPKFYNSLPLAGTHQIQFNGKDEIKKLEKFIYEKEELLELKNKFYDLGQTAESANIDYARSLARKVEVLFIELLNEKELATKYYEDNLKFLNRVSDFLFICARWIEKQDNKLRVRK